VLKCSIRSQRARRYSLEFMFQFAFAFNQSIGNWNTGRVTNMAGRCKLIVIEIRGESAFLFQRLK